MSDFCNNIYHEKQSLRNYFSLVLFLVFPTTAIFGPRNKRIGAVKEFKAISMQNIRNFFCLGYKNGHLIMLGKTSNSYAFHIM